MCPAASLAAYIKSTRSAAKKIARATQARISVASPPCNTGSETPASGVTCLVSLNTPCARVSAISVAFIASVPTTAFIPGVDNDCRPPHCNSANKMVACLGSGSYVRPTQTSQRTILCNVRICVQRSQSSHMISFRCAWSHSKCFLPPEHAKSSPCTSTVSLYP